MKTYIEAIEDTESEEKDFIQEEVESDYGESKQLEAKNRCIARQIDGKDYISGNPGEECTG